MKLYKRNQRILISFEIKEFIIILLSKDFEEIINLASDNPDNLEHAKQASFKLGTKSANSKDYEFWTGVFSLYEEFERNCEFCFYLNDRFNPKVDSINTLEDLEKFKKGEDPPVIIVNIKIILSNLN